MEGPLDSCWKDFAEMVGAATFPALCLLSMLVAACWGLETGADQVNPGAGRGLVVPLIGKPGVRVRGLLRNGTLPIAGAVREVG